MSNLMTEAGKVDLDVSIPDRPRGVHISSLVSLRIMTRDATEARTYLHPLLRSHRRLGPRPWRGERTGGNLEIHPGQLCQYCGNLNLLDLWAGGESDHSFDDDKTLENRQGHHRTPQCLEESAIRCPLCRLFYRELSDSLIRWDRLVQVASPRPVAPNWGKSRFKIWAWNGNYHNYNDTHLGLRYLVLQWCGGGPDVRAQILLTARAGTAFAERGHIISDASAPIIDGIGSPRSWDIILMHWKECMKKHVNCHYDVPGWESNEIVSPRLVPLPTRVIVVDVDNPRLLETKGALGVYAALSHSWGDIHTIRTTRRNFEDHKQHIPLSPIFGTFIDAIATCSVLKIPYLWIDSLCIIQYDETDPLSTRDDSQREIQQMGKIYAQAALTIAATGASDDPTMGLFRGERHRLRQLVEIPLKYSASDKPGEFIYASIKPKTLAEEISDSRLYTRGWVLQERVLSPRYLHFGREQWFWQCRESTVAESDGIAVVINNPVNAFGADLGMVQAMRGSGDEFSFWWTRIVETYTQLDFSYVNDRFDGLRGLMDKLKKETGRQHAWGSWTESLHLQLMWYLFPEDDEDKVRNAKIGTGSENSLPPARRPRTWSWLSCQYPVEFLVQTSTDTTRKIGYPGGTRQHAMFRSGFQNIRKKPTTPGEGRAPHSASPPFAPRDLWDEDLILEGLLRPVLISPTKSASNLTMHPRKKYLKGRIGPIAALMAKVSYTVYDYHLHVEHSQPCTEIPETEVGNATIDDLPSFLRFTSFAQDGEKGLPSEATWPMTVMCFLVSINMVKKDSQLLPAGQGKGTGTETNDRYVSSNVLLLQRIRKDEQKVNMYRRVGIGKVDGKHTGFWDNIERSTILLV